MFLRLKVAQSSRAASRDEQGTCPSGHLPNIQIHGLPCRSNPGRDNVVRTEGTHNQEGSLVGRGRSFLDEDPDRLTVLL